MELSEYLKENLTEPQYVSLHYFLNITKTRCTQMLNRPKSMTVKELNSLAEILSINGDELLEDFRCILVNDYKCGYDVITYGQICDWNAANIAAFNAKERDAVL